VTACSDYFINNKMTQKVTGSKEVKSKVHELNNLLSELNDQGGYFIDFVSTKGIQAGIIRLHAGENDTQEPHSVDDVYYDNRGRTTCQTEVRRSN
jgi:hypothetical protein